MQCRDQVRPVEMEDSQVAPPPEPQSLESWLAGVSRRAGGVSRRAAGVMSTTETTGGDVSIVLAAAWLPSGVESATALSLEGGSQRSMAARIDSSKGVVVEGGGCRDGTGKLSKASCNWVTAAVKKRLSGPNSGLCFMYRNGEPATGPPR